MKKLLLLAAIALNAFNANAQIGATAPDFDVTDLDGNQIRLYQDILDQGLVAVVDVSATWCGPCWTFHSSHVLRDLHNLYGPNGTNQLRVIFYEGDANTTLADLQGETGSTLGNWLADSPYPFINESPITLNMSIWAPTGFPTVNVIRPSDKQIVADTWLQTTVEEQVAVINDLTGVTLEPVGINEVIENEVSFAYPNPANDLLNLDLSEFNGKPTTVEIYNLQGKLTMSVTKTNSLESISVSDLPAGNYLLRVFNNDKTVNQIVSIAH